MSNEAIRVLNELLYFYDWAIHHVGKDRDPYECGTADAFGQAILAVAPLMGAEEHDAYKRVMSFESVEKYKKQYPVPILKAPWPKSS